jgi:hypothetical protein
MDVAGLRSLVRGIQFGVHGVAAVVTPPGGPAVATLVIWLTPSTEAVPAGSDFARRESKRILAIRRDEVPEVPRGTMITTAEPTLSTPDSWRVDAMDSVYPDHYRVVVVPYEPAS